MSAAERELTLCGSSTQKRKESLAGAVTGETLGEYLARWIVACKPRLRPATHTEYARHVNQYWARWPGRR